MGRAGDRKLARGEARDGRLDPRPRLAPHWLCRGMIWFRVVYGEADVLLKATGGIDNKTGRRNEKAAVHHLRRYVHRWRKTSVIMIDEVELTVIRLPCEGGPATWRQEAHRDVLHWLRCTKFAFKRDCVLRFIETATSALTHVLMVAGNHEHYGDVFEDRVPLHRQHLSGATVLDNGAMAARLVFNPSLGSVERACDQI